LRILPNTAAARQLEVGCRHGPANSQHQMPAISQLDKWSAACHRRALKSNSRHEILPAKKGDYPQF
jgi:hypothetical protein